MTTGLRCKAYLCSKYVSLLQCNNAIIYIFSHAYLHTYCLLEGTIEKPQHPT